MIRQFCAYSNPASSGRRAPYLLNVQSDLFDSSSVVVAPLVIPDYFGTPIGRLNPVLTVHDEQFILSPLELTAVLVRDLGTFQSDIGPQRDDIVAALDMLFTGI